MGTDLPGRPGAAAGARWRPAACPACWECALELLGKAIRTLSTRVLCAPRVLGVSALRTATGYFEAPLELAPAPTLHPVTGRPFSSPPSCAGAFRAPTPSIAVLL